MGQTRTGGMSWGVALRLGRVSNLPTVWTNVMAGMALAAPAAVAPGPAIALAVAFSLFYLAGMYLNDAFDRGIDARERPDRPIPSGAISSQAVFGAGFAMMAAGMLVLAGIGLSPDGMGWQVPLAGAALGAAILAYDIWHKANPLSPLVMGLCRALVYVGSAAAVAPLLPGPVLVAALVSVSYLIGLTYTAKQETLARLDRIWPLGFLAVPVVYALWVATDGIAAFVAAAAFIGWLTHALRFALDGSRRDVPRTVVSMIAGICLLDAVFLTASGHTALAALAGLAFLLTLALQRHIAGT